MGLFGNKKQEKIEWTKETAPKERSINFEFKASLLVKGSAESYANYADTRLCNIEGSKTLLTTTDTDRERVKKELAFKLENIYNEICELIDNDTKIFTDEFWSKEVGKNKDGL